MQPKMKHENEDNYDLNESLSFTDKNDRSVGECKFNFII